MAGTKRKSSTISSSKLKRYKQFTASRPSVTTLVKRILNKQSEKKELSNYNGPASAGNVISNSGFVFCVNQVAEGADSNTRIGRRITGGSCEIDYQINNSVALDSGFVALVYDSQPNASNATFGTIFDQSAGQPAGLSFKNTTNYDARFKILWVDHYTVSPGGPQVYKRRKYYNTSALAYEFNGSTASTPSTGALYLTYGSANPVTANLSNITFNTKFKFHDM
jgi:hypothetical protein